MARKRNPIGQWVLYQVLRLFGFVTFHMPLSWARASGNCIGWLAYHCVPRVGGIARANLDLAYGDSLTAKEKRRIGIGAAQNACIVAAEFSRMRELSGDKLNDLVRVVGADRVDRSRGAFLISAHLGNWEWMMPTVMDLGWPTAGVVRPLDYAPLNAWIDSLRSSTGIRTIDKTQSGPEMMRLLKEGWIVGILADQSPREAGVPVTFFGKPCWATVAPAMIAARAKVPIHVTAIVRQPDGNYEMEFSEPIELDRSKPLRAGLVDVSQQCQDVIERLVRDHPSQWLWLHRRWKERPRLEREWAAKDSADAKRDESAKSDRPASN
jgi:KDO2-lipid IV(A) lauroyltransferase